MSGNAATKNKRSNQDETNGEKPKVRHPAIQYSWTPTAGKGKFQEVDKFLLHVDHEYQRDNVNQARVNEIARDWSWAACGCLLVARREDGTLWAFDGQHRLLGARKREDVQGLPCLVFNINEVREEAKAYGDSNTNRGAVKSHEKFKARLVAEDPNALRVAAALEEAGYSVGSGSNCQLSCIDAIERSFAKDSLSASTALAVCSTIYKGAPIRSEAFKGLACLEGFLQKRVSGSITRPDIRSKLTNTTPAELLSKIRESIAYHGKGGERVYADGIVNLVNRRKHSNRIPSPLAS